MNNLESNGESLLRDKLLQHQFAEDDQDWAKMDDLLKAQRPPAPPPAGLTWHFGGKWLLALLGIALASWYLVSLQPLTPAYSSLPSLAPGRGEASQVHPDTRLAAPVSGSSAAVPTGAAGGPRPAQSTRKGTENQPVKPAVSSRQHTTVSALQAILNEQKAVAANHDPSPGDGPAKPVVGLTNSRPEGPVRNAAESGSVPGVERLPANITPNAGNNTTPAGDSVAAPLSRPLPSSLPPTPPLAWLPQRGAMLIGSARQVHAEVPWPKPYGGRRIQIGVVGGGQLAHTPNGMFSKMTVAPTFGISTNYLLTPRWSVQADLLYRSVRYDLQASFAQDHVGANGAYGYWQYNASTSNLEFFEMPLLAKRTLLHGNAHLLGGLRPAMVRPAQTYSGTSGAYTGANPYASFASFRPTAQDGVRRFDLALALGADLRLSRKFWLDVRFNQGLLDLTHDDFFQNTNTDLSMDAQVTLRYYFLAF